MAAKKSFAKLARATATWDPITRPKDYFLLGGYRSPGLADLDDLVEKYRIDVRWGMGLSGASSPMVGRPPIDFRARMRLYSPADWLSWHEFLAVIQPEIVARGIPGAIAKTQAWDIVHPYTLDARITSVMIQEIVHPKRTRDDGEWTAELLLHEWRMPRPSFAKAEAPKGPEPLDDRERQIQALTNELQLKQLAQQ
jgi:hypothetical protein